MTQPTFILRPALHPQDYPQIAALLSQVWPEPVTAAIMAEWMQRKPVMIRKMPPCWRSIATWAINPCPARIN